MDRRLVGLAAQLAKQLERFWREDIETSLRRAGIAGGAIDGSYVTGPPNAHHASHEDGGADELSVAGLSGELTDGQKPKDHDHSGDAGDGGPFDLANLTSGAADAGQVPTADGAGGVAWEDPAGGSALADLTDVDLSTPPTNGQALVYDDTSSTWIPGSGAASPDANAIHVNAAGEIAALDEKTTLADADVLVIEDSEDGNAKKMVQVGNLPGGGGGATISTSAYASPPATPAEGDLWLPSDGVSQYRYSGSDWVPWGPLFPFAKPPIISNWTWINQGGATADETNGGIFLLAPAASGDQLRILKRAAPATPYTVTAAFLPFVHPVNYNQCALCWRESASGKVVALNYTNSGSFQVSKFNSASEYSADYLGPTASHRPGPVIWARIADDGANRICSWSIDGRHWEVLHSVGRTDFLTANEVGFYADANSSKSAGILLLSWEVA